MKKPPLDPSAVPEGYIVIPKGGRPPSEKLLAKKVAFLAAYRWRRKAHYEKAASAWDWLRAHWGGIPDDEGSCRRLIRDVAQRFLWSCMLEVEGKTYVLLSSGVGGKPKDRFLAPGIHPDPNGEGWLWREDLFLAERHPDAGAKLLKVLARQLDRQIHSN